MPVLLNISFANPWYCMHHSSCSFIWHSKTSRCSHPAWFWSFPFASHRSHTGASSQLLARGVCRVVFLQMKSFSALKMCSDSGGAFQYLHKLKRLGGSKWSCNLLGKSQVKVNLLWNTCSTYSIKEKKEDLILKMEFLGVCLCRTSYDVQPQIVLAASPVPFLVSQTERVWFHGTTWIRK